MGASASIDHLEPGLDPETRLSEPEWLRALGRGVIAVQEAFEGRGDGETLAIADIRGIAGLRGLARARQTRRSARLSATPAAAQSSGADPDEADEESDDARRLRVPPTRGLVAHAFSSFWLKKREAHLRGTREWAFAEIAAWLDAPESPQLFWLM